MHNSIEERTTTLYARIIQLQQLAVHFGHYIQQTMFLKKKKWIKKQKFPKMLHKIWSMFPTPSVFPLTLESKLK